MGYKLVFTSRYGDDMGKFIDDREDLPSLKKLLDAYTSYTAHTLKVYVCEKIKIMISLNDLGNVYIATYETPTLINKIMHLDSNLNLLKGYFHHVKTDSKADILRYRGNNLDGFQMLTLMYRMFAFKYSHGRLLAVYEYNPENKRKLTPLENPENLIRILSRIDRSMRRILK